MTFQNLPPETLDSIVSYSISEWLEEGTTKRGLRGPWSLNSRRAFEDLRNYWNINKQYRCIVHDSMRRAIGKLDEVPFTELVARAAREGPADHLLVVQLAYSPEKPDRFKEPCSGSSFKTLLLCLAAASGRCEVIEYLLSKGADLEDTAALNSMERWRTRMTPLHYSVKCGHEDLARLLLHHGAHVNSQVHFESLTPLQEAIQFPSILRLLLDTGADVNMESPLHDAAVFGSAEAVELLVSHGAEIEKIVNNETPLMLSSGASNAEATRKLLEKGANVQAEIQDTNDPPWGANPLYYAIRGKLHKESTNRETLEVLIQYGADINKSVSISYGLREYVPAVSTKSPLGVAIHTLNLSAVKLLLEKGAEWQDTDLNRPTPLQALIHSDRSWWCGSTGLQMLKAILQHGGDPNEHIFSGETPLIVACCCRPLWQTRPAIRELLQWGADVTKSSKGGLSPLRAVYSSHNPLADQLDILQDFYDFSTGSASANVRRMIENVKAKFQEAAPGDNLNSLRYLETVSDRASESDSPQSEGSSGFWMSEIDQESWEPNIYAL